MEHRYSARYENLLLRPLQKEDIEFLRIWRNDKSQTKYLRPIPYITPEMQENWFRNYLENPDEMVFAILETRDLNRIIGSVAVYDFQGDVAEVGKIQIGDPDAAGHGYGRIGMTMAIWIAFQKLNVKKIVASVHRDNLAAYKSDMRIGFSKVGSHEAVMGGFEDEIAIDKKRLMEVNSFLQEIVISEE